MSRRVFLITSNQMKVFEWHGKHLFASYEFKNTEEDFNDFKRYLSSTTKMYSQILLELLEEDFQRDLIPHVHGKDRSALLKRACKKHYGKNRFTYANIIGRDENARRDDEVLLASISNTDPLDFWFEALEAEDVPVCGIWSLPMLSHDLVKLLHKLTHDNKAINDNQKQNDKKHDNILLVSRQMRSTLRESFFRDNKFVLSRQVKIERSSRLLDIPNTYLTTGAEQIHKFLANQRIINFGAKLHVYSLLPHRLMERMENINLDNDIFVNYVFDINELCDQFGLDVDENVESDVLFSYLCSAKSVTSDHYALEENKRSFYRYILDRSIYYTAAVGSLCLFAVGGILAVNAYETDQLCKIAEGSKLRLSKYYNNHYLEHEKAFGSVDQMQSLIDFQFRIRRETDITPQSLFKPLSKVFSKPQFSMLDLYELNWSKMYGTDLDQKRDFGKAIATPKDKIDTDQYNTDGFGEISKKSPVLHVSGRMRRDNIDYRNTVSIINLFVENLREIDFISDIYLLKIPVDIRTYSQFDDLGGLKKDLYSRSEDADNFEIMIIFKSSDDRNTNEVGSEKSYLNEEITISEKDAIAGIRYAS